VSSVARYECVTHNKPIEAGSSFLSLRPLEWYKHVFEEHPLETRHHFIMYFANGSTNEAEVCNGKITYFPEMRTRELVNPYIEQSTKQAP